MPNTKFITEQPLRNPGFIALLILMSLLLVNHLINGVLATWWSASITMAITLLLAAGWYAVFSSRLRIKISAKYLKVRTKGIIGRRIKLARKDMVDCTFVKVKPSERWSGSLTHPASDFKCIDFGGLGGLCISMRDGRSYFIGSDELFARRHDMQLPTSVAAS